jgi:hypothetical protein
MKKKRKFSGADGSYVLDDDAKAAGLSIGRNPNIREADRAAAIAEVERNVAKSKGMLDKDAELLMKYDLLPADMQTPAGQAESIPVPAPRANAGRPLAPRVTTAGNPESYGTAPRSTVEGNPDAYTPPKSTVERRFPQRTDFMGDPTRNPSRGSYDRPGPISGAVDAIGELIGNLPRIQAARKRALQRKDPKGTMPMKKGGAVKASKRGDGIAQRGKTKGRMC